MDQLIRLNDPQAEVWDGLTPKTTTSLPWGRGVGKSWFLRAIQHMLIAEWDGALRSDALVPFQGVRIVWLMPTLKQFKAVHGQLIENELAEDWAWLGGKVDRTSWRITFPGGSWVQPFPAVEHRSKAARGLRCDVVLIDETDDIDRAVFEAILRPWWSEPWSLKIGVAGGTPTRGRNGLLYHLHKLGLDPTKPRYRTRHATYRDAPETVDITEVEDARQNSPITVFKREWECDFDSAEGLVYAFDESFHVREPPPEVRFHRYAVGVDHGWTDPGVYLLAGIAGHGEDATVWFLDEVVATEKPNAWWNQKAEEWQHFNARWYCDPSRPDRIADLRRIVSARGADNAIEAGVARVADLLAIREPEAGAPYARMYVSPKCKNLIREMGLYRRKKDPHQADAFLEDIEGRHDHCQDSARYLCIGEFGPLGGPRRDTEWH